MKLAEILAVCSALLAVPAVSLEGVHSANNTRSEPALALAATLQPINATHVKASITNTYSQQISVLSWNNHFQTRHNAAHGSFRLTHSYPNHSIQTLGRGPNVGNFRFAEATPSHFFNISARDTYSDTFDLTELYKVPEAGSYNVTMDFVSPATLLPEGTDLSTVLVKVNRRKGEKHVQGLPKVRIKSKIVTMYLQSSPPSPASRKRGGRQGSCASQPQTSSLIIKARGNARSLARFSQGAVLPPMGIGSHGLIDSTLWNLYFNNDSVARNVSSVYKAIANYGHNGNTAGISEYCDLNDHDTMCTDDGGAIAYNTDPDGSGVASSITLCSYFFTLPVEDKCNYPSEMNNGMHDQGGLFLHELAKCQQLTGVANITEGVDEECYTWDCATAAAAHLNGEKAYLLATNYEFMAYAARAQLNPHCPKASAIGPEPLPSQSAGVGPGASDGSAGAGTAAGSRTGLGAAGAGGSGAGGAGSGGAGAGGSGAGGAGGGGSGAGGVGADPGGAGAAGGTTGGSRGGNLGGRNAGAVAGANSGPVIADAVCGGSIDC